MTKLITDAFPCRNANYIQIHSRRAEACLGTDTSTGNKAGTYSLTDDRIMELFNFLIHNILYPCRISGFSASHKYPNGYRLCTSDCVLFSFEFEFMKKLIRTDISVARKFNKTFI